MTYVETTNNNPLIIINHIYLHKQRDREIQGKNGCECLSATPGLIKIYPKPNRIFDGRTELGREMKE